MAGTYFGKALIGGAAFMLPSIAYLSMRSKKPWKKIVVATLVFGLLFGFLFEFIQEYTNTYLVVSRVFPKLFGVLPLDNVLGHMMMACLTFTFYEHFINRHSDSSISPIIKLAVYPAIILMIAEITIHTTHPSLLMLHYSYAWLGALAVTPLLYLLARRPAYTRDVFLMVPFFFILYLVVELDAVRYGWWIYPGHGYIGWVTLFGRHFPFEELFFWMFFYAAAITSYYVLY